MATDHNIRQLIINKVPTKAQYDQMVKNADELYLTPDDSNGLPDQTGQSGKFLKTNGTNASWDNVPAGTVTSVRVQAGTGLSSSQSTAQTSTLNTTISIASGYKLPTTTEWSGKQDTISDLATIRSGAEAGATAVQPGDLATVATSGAYSDLSGTPSLSTVAISGSYNDLSNKPTIPTVNNAVLTIQKNGTTVSTFTANSATNAVANITVPTKVSDLNNDSGFITGITANNVTTALGYTPYDSTNPNGYITSADIPTIKNLNTNNTTGQTASSSESLTGTGTVNLHKVSKTGSYNDLLNKPTIPTVNNATVTIQKNSTNVGSFTLNQSGNATVNITVPTKLSEFTDDLGSSPTHTHSQYLTSHQSIKTLNTTNTTAQSISASEAITGTGTLNLHKVSKTGTFNDLISKPTSISGYGITDAYTKTEVDGLISSVYKPAGSVAYASLPTLASGVLGNVYNVTDAFTTDTRFVEGSGKSYPAGTNVVVVEPTSGTYKFDVLAGFVDLSGYVPTTRKVNNKALSADITLSASDVGALPDSTTIPQGTVKSVQVQAGTGLTSSTSTAQNTTLSTTISIASGYKLPTTTEWGNKQDALAIQTAYTSKGSATKVPQITTNTLGQVTGITEVDITQPTVNNSTITIQKNGTNVDSFTTNQSSNKNINITVPTTAADVGAVSTTDGVTGVVAGSTADKINVTKNGTTSTITVNNVANAIEAAKVTTQASNTNADAIIFFAKASSSNKEIAYDDDFKYNPNTNKLTVNNIDGKINGDNYINWGGPNLSASMSPSDAGCLDENGHNKAAFFAGKITTEYSTDGGATWTSPYVLTDTEKFGFTTKGSYQVRIGNVGSSGVITAENVANYLARVTISSRNASGSGAFYTSMKKLILNVSTNGATGTSVKIETRTIANYNNNVDSWSTRGTYNVGGWSGYNSIPCNITFGGGTTQTSQIADLRLTLSATGASSTSANNFSVFEMKIIGVTNWSVNSFAYTGHIYDFDKDKNVTFPNKVTASTGGFVGNLTGTADKATKDGDNNTISSTYLKLAGGTMTGGLKFGTSAIPQETNPTYMLSMDAFASGGAVKWVSVANIKAGKDGDGNTISSTYLKAHQDIKTLNTTNTTAQTTSASEDIKGSGTINLHKVSKTGSYNDLLDKPTIPTVNNATLTIQKNGTTVKTFTANASTDVTANITVPTKVSDLTNDSGYTTNTGTVTSVRVQAGTGLSSSTSTAQSTSLNTTISIASGYKLPTTTEWSGKQDALPSQSGNSGKFLTTNGTTMSWGTVSIPTVNNSTITIQKNGTNVDSFTTNAASGKNINITLAKGDVGLGNVDNTSDLDKPISTATQTALDAKQNTISDLGYIRNQVAKVDDKISGIDITDSGDSLPSAAGYSVNDTFLNKTDKKLYTVETPAWQLGPNVSSSSGITVDLTNGVATGFTTISNPGGTSYTNMLNSYQKDVGNSPIYFHFKTGSTIPTYGYIIAFSTTVTYYQQYLGISAISDSKLQINCFTYYNGNSTNRFNHQLFDTSLEPNTEYYIYITYNGSEYISTLSSTGYNVNILETSTIEESTTQYGSSIYYGGFLSRWPTYNGMTVYLADSMGEFVVPDGALTWDSGTTLEDNTQYNDTTNEKTIYYNNNILYDSGDSLPSQSGQSGKFLTTNGTVASWGSVDALPSQSGQSGKYLTTNGTTASWATVQAGPKFLSFTNVTANNWVNDTTYTGYIYKCTLTCNGVTSSDYAQVIFGPTQSVSGDYANVCLTDTDTVTIYSKVNTSISIPNIIVLGNN